MPFKQLPPDYKPEIDLIDRRQEYSKKLISQKDKLIEEAVLPLIKTLYEVGARLRCTVNTDKIETYYLDDIPVIEIHPMEFKREYNGGDEPTLTAYYNYKILYKGDKNAV